MAVIFAGGGGIMLRRAVRVAGKVVLITTALILAALLIRDSSDHFAGARYDAAASTASKFAAMRALLPQDAELIVVVDPQELFAVPGIKQRLQPLLQNTRELLGIDTALVAGQLSQAHDIGLIAMAIELDAPGASAEGLLIVQGDIDREALVKSVDQALAVENERLERADIGGVHMFRERPVGSSFAFAFPDATHMVVGQSDAIERLVRASGEPRERTDVGLPDHAASAPIFGRLALTARLKDMLPSQLAWPDSIVFSSGADLTVRVVVPADSTARANDLMLFFEGVRASYIISADRHSKLNNLLRSTRITLDRAHVTIDIPL